VNLEKITFAFFILLASTLNFGFFVGDPIDPAQHHAYELFAALAVSLIATIIKFGDRTHVGAVLLAASLVADLGLLAACLVWGITVYAMNLPPSPANMSSIVSLSGGALLANLVSVALLMIEVAAARR
jgi:hypothetical protein